jgi:hypothetical protein
MERNALDKTSCIIDHAETAYISRVLVSAQLAPCKVRPDVGDMAFHVKQEYSM